MTVLRNGAAPSGKRSAAQFPGDVRADAPFMVDAPGRVGGGLVTFEPGARTHWHTHPLGQVLIVTTGLGWTQCEGGPKVEIRPGDIIQCPCRTRHWHGATPTTAMTHLAITEFLDGVAVEWMEPVSDEQYLSGPVQTD